VKTYHRSSRVCRIDLIVRSSLPGNAASAYGYGSTGTGFKEIQPYFKNLRCLVG